MNTVEYHVRRNETNEAAHRKFFVGFNTYSQNSTFFFLILFLSYIPLELEGAKQYRIIHIFPTIEYHITLSVDNISVKEYTNTYTIHCHLFKFQYSHFTYTHNAYSYRTYIHYYVFVEFPFISI